MRYDFSRRACVLALMLFPLSGCSESGDGPTGGSGGATGGAGGTAGMGGTAGTGGSGGNGGNGGAVDPPEPITLISKDSNGFQGNGYSSSGAASADGRYVAIHSDSDDLVANDTNMTLDVFLHDTQTGTTTRVSVASDGTEADEVSGGPNVSADGRYVLFISWATNLVTNDTNMVGDVFLHDMQSGTTTRVSVDAVGKELNGASIDGAISADGRYVAFSSEATNAVPDDTNAPGNVFVRDLQTGTVTRVSLGLMGAEADGQSSGPAISADGRYISFVSRATNLVTGDTNNFEDIFVHDRDTGANVRASVGPGGAESDRWSYGPEISSDGRYVAFYSDATNLVPADTNGVEDIFLHDTQTGTTTRVSVASDGSEANGVSDALAISGDGRYVAFSSEATNLVSGDTNNDPDTFVRDTQTNTTIRVSVAADGSEANRSSTLTGMSRDGRYVLFYSTADNLVPEASNAKEHLFRAPNE